jgi:hypothetical protein
MQTWQKILRHFEQMPRGYAADGRQLGLGLATAIKSSKELQSTEGVDASVTVPEPRTERAGIRG